jgi:hypothetical protein
MKDATIDRGCTRYSPHLLLEMLDTRVPGGGGGERKEAYLLLEMLDTRAQELVLLRCAPGLSLRLFHSSPEQLPDIRQLC